MSDENDDGETKSPLRQRFEEYGWKAVFFVLFGPLAIAWICGFLGLDAFSENKWFGILFMFSIAMCANITVVSVFVLIKGQLSKKADVQGYLVLGAIMLAFAGYLDYVFSLEAGLLGKFLSKWAATPPKGGVWKAVQPSYASYAQQTLHGQTPPFGGVELKEEGDRTCAAISA